MAKDYVEVSQWDHLKQFGINCLTGEACKYAQRLLCDLNEDGAALIMDYLGVTMLRENWNSTVNDKPAVASVMLHRESLQQIAQFAIMRMNPFAIMYGNHAVIGIFTPEAYDRYSNFIRDFPSSTKEWKLHTLQRSLNPGDGSRNQHAFSGRTV